MGRIEKALGEVMLAELQGHTVRELAEAVVTLDTKLESAVQLLGVQQPDEGEVRVATCDG
eukprot:3562299-Pleurochrysis_carterae.AAC.2